MKKYYEMMTDREWCMVPIETAFPFLAESGHVVSLTGAGGKTTLMYALAKAAAGLGKCVCVSTTTHIFKPDDPVHARTLAEAEALWTQGSYAVIGTETAEGKLTEAAKPLSEACIRRADISLFESDGSKHFPVKVPAAHEPVLRADSDLVIGVAGMSALFQPLRECCFRLTEAAALLGVTAETPLTPQLLADILASEQGTRKMVGARNYMVVLNQCDTKEDRECGRQIAALLRQKGIAQVVLSGYEA